MHVDHGQAGRHRVSLFEPSVSELKSALPLIAQIAQSSTKNQRRQTRRFSSHPRLMSDAFLAFLMTPTPMP